MLLDVKETRLSNGVRVVTANMSRVESVAVGICVGVGSRHETRDMSGMSHFIEHLLFKGTEKLSARDISRAIEGCGGYFNAFTQEEMTCYYARVAYNHIWKVLRILSDMVLYPRFDASDIEKERSVIIEEIMMYRDHPEHMVQEMLNSILWKNHQLGWSLVGTPASLRRMTRDDILRFKRKKYVAQNTVFAFAGRICHEDGVSRVEKLMTGYPALGKPPAKPVTPDVRQEKTILKRKDIEQTQLAIGFRTFGLFDKRRYALKVLCVILGENTSSRLFQVVREKHGLAYSVNAGFQLFADTGSLVISAGLDRERRRKALELIVREVSRLKQEPVKSKELARAKEYVVGHLRLGVESPSGQMMWVGGNILNYGVLISAEEVIDAIYAVRSADVQALAGTVFRERVVSLALLSPGLAGKDGEHARFVLATL